jgi:antitoxin ParD1/3/4
MNVSASSSSCYPAFFQVFRCPSLCSVLLWFRANPNAYPFLVLLKNIEAMSKNTSISLGTHFDQFVSSQVTGGRYKNVSEVIRAGLRLLEDEETKVIALRSAIQEGIDSGIAHDFVPRQNLQALKAGRRANG